MARKQEFNRRDILLQSAQLFAAHGYAGTSIDQIVTSTKLKRGSLYQAFASKSGLFRAALAEQVSSLKDSGTADLNLATDLVIVALWERAAADKMVADMISEVLPVLATLGQASVQEVLYRRLIHRLRKE